MVNNALNLETEGEGPEGEARLDQRLRLASFLTESEAFLQVSAYNNANNSCVKATHANLSMIEGLDIEIHEIRS